MERVVSRDAAAADARGLPFRAPPPPPFSHPCPVREIAGVITALATGSPDEQRAVLDGVFLSDAAFSHPFCHVPFYGAPVRLVAILQLSQRPPPDGDPGQERTRYFITSQQDLYTLNACAQFLLPGLGPFLWSLWQLFSTGLCVVGALVFMPLYLFLNRNASAHKVQ